DQRHPFADAGDPALALVLEGDREVVGLQMAARIADEVAAGRLVMPAGALRVVEAEPLAVLGGLVDGEIVVLDTAGIAADEGDVGIRPERIALDPLLAFAGAHVRVTGRRRRRGRRWRRGGGDFAERGIEAGGVLGLEITAAG